MNERQETTQKTEAETPTKIKVLHVDDSAEFVEISTTFLQETNDRLELKTETDPTEAVRLLEEEDEEFDCVVSDCSMPDMEIDGKELHSEVRSARPSLPFVFFTGTPASELGSVVSDEATTHLTKGMGIEQFSDLSNHIKEVVESGDTRERE